MAAFLSLGADKAAVWLGGSTKSDTLVIEVGMVSALSPTLMLSFWMS